MQLTAKNALMETDMEKMNSKLEEATKQIRELDRKLLQLCDHLKIKVT